jgi:hypothetical protein
MEDTEGKATGNKNNKFGEELLAYFPLVRNEQHRKQKINGE